MDLKLSAVAIGLMLMQLAFLDVKAQTRDNDATGDLIERMQRFEIREKFRDNENTQLKQRLLALENVVKNQQNQIHALKETISKHDDTNTQLLERVQYLETREKADDSLLRAEVHSQKKRIQFVERFIRTLANKLGDSESPVNKLAEIRNHSENESTPRRYIRGSAAQRIQIRDNEETVAFFAYLGNHVESPGVHQIIPFEHVVTNIGNGYNPHAGDFRAPVAGTYVFATTLLAGDVHVEYHFQIMHNAKPVSSLFIVNGGTASQEVVLQLNQGDDVSIHNLDAGHRVYGSGYSTFSGFLLQQNYSSPAVVGR